MLKYVAIAILSFAVLLFSVLDANLSLFLFDKLSSRVPPRFVGQRVWVTGASSGIGKELSIRLCKEGAVVVASARRESELTEVARECNEGKGRKEGWGKILPLAFDVMEDEDSLKLRTKTAMILMGGGIDVLVLNAGRSQRQPAVSTPLSTTQALMSLNLYAPISISLAVLAEADWLSSSRGHIVVTSSLAGKLPVALSTSYAASKGALNQYFSGLRSELPGLRVDLVCPGPVATPIASFAHTASLAAGSAAAPVNEGSESKMPVARCVSLMLSGMSGPWWAMYETWISEHPPLLFAYFGQYVPGLTNALAKVVGPKRVEAFTAGKDIYNMKSWGKGQKN